jgi:ADP-heptose:LPS heptosyltransferase
MSLSLIKWIDQFFGATLCLLLWLEERLRYLTRLTPNPQPPTPNPCKILFIKLWGMGSILNAVPAFAAAKRRNDESANQRSGKSRRTTHHAPRTTQVYLLTFQRNAQICELLNAVDGVLLLENPSHPMAFIADILRLLRRLRAERFDVVIDLEFFVRFTTILTCLSNAPCRVGFDSPKLCRSSLYTHVAPFRAHAHIAECFLDLVRCIEDKILRCAQNDTTAPCHSERSEESQQLCHSEHSEESQIPALKPLSAEALQHSNTPTLQYSNLVCLNPNASEVSHLSRWMPENFARLADELIERHGVTVGLTGAPNEVKFVESVRRRARHADDIVNFAGKTSVPEFITLLQRCRVFITNDSGPMHLAAALGVPTIALFGPDTPTRFGPRGAQHVILYKPPPCSPCYNFYDNKSSRCRNEVYQCCLKSITVEEVAAAAEKYLKRET